MESDPSASDAFTTLDWAMIGVGVLAWSLLAFLVTRYWPNTKWRRKLPFEAHPLHLLLIFAIFFVVLQIGGGLMQVVSTPPPANFYFFKAEQVRPRTWQKFYLRLVVEGKKGVPSPAGRIWRGLSDDLKAELEHGSPTPAQQRAFADQLNQQLSQPNFYFPAAWESIAFSAEVEMLRGQWLAANQETLEAQKPGPFVFPSDWDQATQWRFNRGAFDYAFYLQVKPKVMVTSALVLSLICYVVFFTLVLVIWTKAFDLPLDQLGLHGEHLGTAMSYGVSQVLVWMPPTSFVMALAVSVTPNAVHPTLLALSGDLSTFDWIIILLTVAVVVPAFEEFMVRGLLMPTMNQVMPAWLAIVMSALFFGILHYNVWPTPIPLTVLGIGLGITYQRTGSLMAPIACHSMFNSVTIAYHFWLFQ